jgi:hypothetical protein
MQSADRAFISCTLSLCDALMRTGTWNTLEEAAAHYIYDVLPATATMAIGRTGKSLDILAEMQADALMALVNYRGVDAFVVVEWAPLCFRRRLVLQMVWGQ